MISVAQAWQHICECLTPCSKARVSVDDAAGAVLAQPVVAERDQPPFDRVMMDGIALDADALDAGLVQLQRQGVQAAGAARQTLAGRHRYIEIMTGAVVPRGADTIVPVEALEFSGGQVTLMAPEEIERGQFIHRQGSDYEAGAQLLTPGTRLRGPEMAVLASSGLARIEVAVPPTVAIVAVGDELVDPGVPISDVQIRRSNDYAIAATLSRHGAQVRTRLTLPDDPPTLQRQIGDAIDAHDMVVLSGGVSMGKFDYIPGIMRALGVRIALHKVAQKPGKPMWIGSREKTVVFALPGNPVSALTCARRYVLPAIARAMGERATDEYVQLGAPAQAPSTLTWFPPVVMADDGRAQPKTLNTSGDFHGLAGTAGFVEIPAGAAPGPGDAVRLWRW